MSTLTNDIRNDVASPGHAINAESPDDFSVQSSGPRTDEEFWAAVSRSQKESTAPVGFDYNAFADAAASDFVKQRDPIDNETHELYEAATQSILTQAKRDLSIQLKLFWVVCVAVPTVILIVATVLEPFSTPYVGIVSGFFVMASAVCMVRLRPSILEFSLAMPGERARIKLGITILLYGVFLTAVVVLVDDRMGNDRAQNLKQEQALKSILEMATDIALEKQRAGKFMTFDSGEIISVDSQRIAESGKSAEYDVSFNNKKNKFLLKADPKQFEIINTVVGKGNKRMAEVVVGEIETQTQETRTIRIKTAVGEIVEFHHLGTNLVSSRPALVAVAFKPETHEALAVSSAPGKLQYAAEKK